MKATHNDEAPEPVWDDIKSRHKLTSLHIFSEPPIWRVFGFRNDPKGYQASVEQGGGATIVAALQNLDARLIEGPIHK